MVAWPTISRNLLYRYAHIAHFYHYAYSLTSIAAFLQKLKLLKTKTSISRRPGLSTFILQTLEYRQRLKKNEVCDVQEIKYNRPVPLDFGC